MLISTVRRHITGKIDYIISRVENLESPQPDIDDRQIGELMADYMTSISVVTVRLHDMTLVHFGRRYTFSLIGNSGFCHCRFPITISHSVLNSGMFVTKLRQEIEKHMKVSNSEMGS